MEADTDPVSEGGDSDTDRYADPLYTEHDISDQLERHRDVSGDRDPDPDEVSDELGELAEKINEVSSLLSERYDSLKDYLPHYFPDVVDEDELIDSSFDKRAMMRAYILKMISPNVGGFDSLEWTLEHDQEFAEALGFEPGEIPDHTTFSTQWWERYRPGFRDHARYEAARAAVRAQEYGIEVSEGAEELIEEFDRSEPDEREDIPDEHRLELEERDRVFNEFRDLINDVVEYDRAYNKSKRVEELNELATFTARRRETISGGRDVYVKENEITDGGYMSSETYAKPIRKLTSQIARDRYSEHSAIVPGKEDECEEWKIDAEDQDYGNGKTPHKRTERGIEKQVDMLQSRGMLDRPVDICIDGTKRNYHKRSDTEVGKPPGVHHRWKKFDTGYGWEDLTVTAIYRGRAIVLGSFSYHPDNDLFLAVRYLIDRAMDLVNVRNVYADSEFATVDILSYLTQKNLDYVFSVRETEKVQDVLADEMSGKADWTSYTITSGSGRTHRTTMAAVEKWGSHPEKDDDDDEDSDTEQTTLDTNVDEFQAEDENLMSFEELAEAEDVEYAALITNHDITDGGIDPRENPIAHDPTGTVWGVAQLYRNRWSIETAFRDLKRNFKGKPRSRHFGIRRFFFMLCILLYNCWVLLNVIVADEVEHRDNDEIIWRKKIFVIDLQNELFDDREFG